MKNSVVVKIRQLHGQVYFMPNTKTEKYTFANLVVVCSQIKPITLSILC